MIRLVVAGASGRMGSAILQCAARDSNFKIAGALEHPKSEWVGKELAQAVSHTPSGIRISSDAAAVVQGADILIDFTHPSALAAHLKAVSGAKRGYVLGTTGIDLKNLDVIREASKTVPIVQSPNMSVGVNLLFKLVEFAASALDESYDIEISEIHHRMKKDAPSGTAMKLLEILSNIRKKNLKTNSIFGREGEIGARPQGQIGVLALRGGDVVGDHTVYFLGEGERIELTHKASSREAFALGALRAAKFVAGRKSGLYNMADVLGLA